MNTHRTVSLSALQSERGDKHGHLAPTLRHHLKTEMGKKQRANNEEGPTPGPVKDKDTMQRLNFLYQTSVYLAQVAGSDPGPSTSKTNEEKAELSAPEPRTGRNSIMDLSRHHLRTMKAIGAKSVLRMDPSVKRTICKGCQAVLIPGVTAKVRTKSSRTHKHITRYICQQCKKARDIPSPPIKPPEAADSASAELSPDDGKNSSGRKPKRKERRFHPPPLFERDVGHIVIVGNPGRPTT
ncbi:hypothetical protein FS837_012118 [Tulasnella sp. UAMH 9824]|nr:hypothetical protein FS837_012118 [Tulasnella sp. UAMH 9824]